MGEDRADERTERVSGTGQNRFVEPKLFACSKESGARGHVVYGVAETPGKDIHGGTGYALGVTTGLT
jgi:hypothetical protein